MLFLGKGGGYAVPAHRPSDTRVEDWVNTRALLSPCSLFQAGLGLCPAGLGLGLVGPVPVYAVMPTESLEVFSRDLICT